MSKMKSFNSKNNIHTANNTCGHIKHTVYKSES